jgi:hypothetical protein
MAILGVDDFKSKLTGGGARANLFKATVNFPSYVNPDMELTSFLCKGVQIPSSTIAPIAIPFRGRQLQMAGDRTFEPLSLTIINDSDFQVRNAFESWANGINNFATNTGLANMNDYISDVVVEQLNKAGEVTKKYDFRGCWPSSISTIDLNYDSENTIEEFTVEL